MITSLSSACRCLGDCLTFILVSCNCICAKRIIHFDFCTEISNHCYITANDIKYKGEEDFNIISNLINKNNLLTYAWDIRKIEQTPEASDYFKTNYYDLVDIDPPYLISKYNSIFFLTHCIYTGAQYVKDGKQVYEAPKHFAQYGLVGGEETLSLEFILGLYEEALTTAVRCCKKGGYIYIKCQNQVTIHMTYKIQSIIDENFKKQLSYQRILLSFNIVFVSLCHIISLIVTRNIDSNINLPTNKYIQDRLRESKK